jgi:hypothetical protein
MISIARSFRLAYANARGGSSSEILECVCARGGMEDLTEQTISLPGCRTQKGSGKEEVSEATPHFELACNKGQTVVSGNSECVDVYLV